MRPGWSFGGMQQSSRRRCLACPGGLRSAWSWPPAGWHATGGRSNHALKGGSELLHEGIPADDPTRARSLTPLVDRYLPAGDLLRRDHLNRPRPTGTDDARQRRPRPVALGGSEPSAPARLRRADTNRSTSSAHADPPGRLLLGSSSSETSLALVVHRVTHRHLPRLLLPQGKQAGGPVWRFARPTSGSPRPHRLSVPGRVNCA